MRRGFVWASALGLLVACKAKPPEPLHVAAAADLAPVATDVLPAGSMADRWDVAVATTG